MKKFVSQILFAFAILASTSGAIHAEVSIAPLNIEKEFDIEKDFVLFNFDLKTDVDDVHTVAALDLILKAPRFQSLNYLAVSGTYGVQGGLYVPANRLFDMVFADNWVDAHLQREKALASAAKAVQEVLNSGGRVWVVEAGQSDFTKEIIETVEHNGTKVDKAHFVVVQHSSWNENETSRDALHFVQNNTSYYKIPDGNTADNGTPGFNTVSFPVKTLEESSLLSSQVWQEANKISEQFNGVNERYKNENIANGGADFSDLVEVTWILDITNVDTVEQFFAQFNRKD